MDIIFGLYVHRDLMDIRVPRWNDENRLMGLPIIKLEFEKDTLESHIIIGKECIELRNKRERSTLYEQCFQFRHPKKYCRGNRELCKDCTKPPLEGEVHNCEGDFCLYCKETHKTGDKKICGEYIKEVTIHNKIRLDKL